MTYQVGTVWYWLLVWLLFQGMPGMPDQLECTEVQVIGTDLPNFLAGRIEIRCNGDWRAVCDNMWDEREARIVCQVLGFEQRGHCTHSCFGENDSIPRVKLMCPDSAQTLANCTVEPKGNCEQAGVRCVRETSQPTNPIPCPATTCPPQLLPPCPTTQPRISCLTCPTVTCPTAPTCDCSSCPSLALTTKEATPTTAGGKGEEQREGPVSCTVIGGGLGALAASLGLALVGVVMGWVWHCHRKHNSKKDRDAVIATRSNPSYHSVAPSTQYSSQGPKDTPLSAPPPNTAETSFGTYDVVESPAHFKGGPTPLEERVYQVLEGPGEGRKEGEGPDYQEEGEEGGGRGLDYEVPLPTATLEQAKKQAETHYSSLQHHY